MIDPCSSNSSERFSLSGIITAYLEAAASGQAPYREQLIVTHPDLADGLRAFFADHDKMTQAAAPVCAALGDDPARISAATETFPQVFGDYELLEEIGRGGMGIVYKARQISLNRQPTFAKGGAWVLGQGGMGVVFRAEEQQPRRLVALKVMKPHSLESDSARQRFLREGQALAEVQHDRIIPIFRVGKANGVLFLAMPLLRGESLQARLEKQSPLTLRDAVGIGRWDCRRIGGHPRGGVGPP